MNIAVVGAGIFGCHLAKHLLSQGHSLTIFEKTGIFAAASGNNQDRVHLGFHYPRSAKTRKEILHCHERFVAAYPTIAVLDNLYAVANTSSIDFLTYKGICRSSGLRFQEVNPANYGLLGVEGVIRTPERALDTPATVAMFRKCVGDYLCYEEVSRIEQSPKFVVVNDRPFDAVLNCTHLQLAGVAFPVYYEAAMLLNLKGPAGHPSFTVMDGPFPALMATARPNEYTLSHVTHTSLAKCKTYAEAQEVLSKTKWQDRAERFVDAAAVYYPEIRQSFEVIGARMAVKTKPIDDSDSRHCLTHSSGRVMTVVCGKFGAVMIAQERVSEWLKSLETSNG